MNDRAKSGPDIHGHVMQSVGTVCRLSAGSRVLGSRKGSEGKGRKMEGRGGEVLEGNRRSDRQEGRLENGDRHREGWGDR